MACQARVNDMMEHFSKAVFNQTGTNINVRLEESNVVTGVPEKAIFLSVTVNN
jgi:hypothetical protein